MYKGILPGSDMQSVKENYDRLSIEACISNDFDSGVVLQTRKERT